MSKKENIYKENLHFKWSEKRDVLVLSSRYYTTTTILLSSYLLLESSFSLFSISTGRGGEHA